jgi:hypothetical protein
VATTPNPCDILLERKQHKLAGDCFWRLAETRSGSQLSLIEIKNKYLHLQRAAYAYRQAAQESQVKAEQNYLLTRSLAMLQQILTKKLCGEDDRCKPIQAMHNEIEKAIAYAQLSLSVAEYQQTKVIIEGYNFREELPIKPNHVLRLVPGNYKLTISSDQRMREQEIVLPPNATQSLHLSAPAPPTPPPVRTSALGPAIALSGGVVAVIISSVLLGVGYGTLSDAKNVAEQQIADRRSKIPDVGNNPIRVWEQSAQQIDENTKHGQSLTLNGWILGAVGLSASIAGLLWLILRPYAAGPTTKPSSIPTSQQAMPPSVLATDSAILFDSQL